LKVLQAWNKISLVKRIIIGLIIGIILGVVVPKASVIAILGNLFVGALKALAPLLVFFLVMNSLAQRKKGSGSNIGTIIILYLVGTLCAAFCAVAASFLFPSELILAENLCQLAIFS